MSKRSTIPLFFWSSVLFEKKQQENYGDLLSKFIVEKVSGRNVTFYNAPKKRKAFFQKKHLLAIGSILSYASERSHVWGSGIISRKDLVGRAKFHAVRGPKTRERILELGYDCPKVYGDPALLLPIFYNPKIPKTHKLGIIPHYIDFLGVSELYKDRPEIKVIDLIGNDLEATTNEILSCEQTISSSLHGVIVSHAYGIGSVWVRFSDKLTGDNVKFEDYFLSVEIDPYSGTLLTDIDDRDGLMDLFQLKPTLPDLEVIKRVQQFLVESFPGNFKS